MKLWRWKHCDGEPIGIIEKSENIVLAIRRRLDRSDLELTLNELHPNAFLTNES